MSEEAPKRKRGNPAWVKGISGNPGGRDRKTEEQKEAQRALEAQCRELTPEALKVIVNIMHNGDTDRAKLSAAELILERGWGKAPQTIEAFISPLDGIDIDEQRAIVEALLALEREEAGTIIDVDGTRH